MIKLSFSSYNQEIDKIIRAHVNKQMAGLVKWYVAEYGLESFLPDYVIAADPSCLNRLLNALLDPDVKALEPDDNVVMIMIGVLEAEKKYSDIGIAPFSESVSNRLKLHMLDPKYFEDYGNYKDLFI